MPTGWFKVRFHAWLFLCVFPVSMLSTFILFFFLFLTRSPLHSVPFPSLFCSFSLSTLFSLLHSVFPLYSAPLFALLSALLQLRVFSLCLLPVLHLLVALSLFLVFPFGSVLIVPCIYVHSFNKPFVEFILFLWLTLYTLLTIS